MARRRVVRLLLPFVAAGALAQSFQERVNVELVRVELLATDRQGRPVSGLRPSEIVVRVDGRRVSIEGLEPLGVSLPELPTSPPRPAPTPEISEAASPTPAARPARHSYYMGFFVDETSSEQSNRQAMYKQLFEFLEKPLPPDVEVLLMRFNGALHIETPWSSDIGRLRGAVATMSQRKAAAILGPPRTAFGQPRGGCLQPSARGDGRDGPR